MYPRGQLCNQDLHRCVKPAGALAFWLLTLATLETCMSHCLWCPKRLQTYAPMPRLAINLVLMPLQAPTLSPWTSSTPSQLFLL